MEDKGGVYSGAAGVVRAEVVELGIAAKQVALLLVYHQLLHQLIVLGHVQVVANRRFASPVDGDKTIGVSQGAT